MRWRAQSKVNEIRGMDALRSALKLNRGTTRTRASQGLARFIPTSHQQQYRIQRRNVTRYATVLALANDLLGACRDEMYYKRKPRVSFNKTPSLLLALKMSAASHVAGNLITLGWRASFDRTRSISLFSL